MRLPDTNPVKKRQRLGRILDLEINRAIPKLVTAALSGDAQNNVR